MYPFTCLICVYTHDGLLNGDGVFSTAHLGKLLNSQDRRFNGISPNGHVRDVHEDLLLFGQSHHELLCCGTSDHQDGLLQVSDITEVRLKNIGRRRCHFWDAGEFTDDRHRWSGEVELSFHGFFQQHVYCQHAVDLVGSFEDPVDPGVAIGQFSSRFSAVPHAAKHLYGFVHRVVQYFRSEYLDHGAFRSEIGNAL